MMPCIQNCVQAKCLISPNLCDDPQTLTLGVLAIGTDYTVYIEDQNTGNLRQFNVTSNGAGIVTLDITANLGFFHSLTTYRVWVTLQDANLTDQEEFTQDSVEYTCVILRFEQVTTDGGAVVALATQNIEVDA